MTKTEDTFDIQKTSISNEKWTVNLYYESWSANIKTISETKNDIIIELSEKGEWTSLLKLEIININGKIKNCLINGIDGGNYFHIAKVRASLIATRYCSFPKLPLAKTPR